MRKGILTFFGEVFLSYFPEGRIKNIIKCFLANNFLFKSNDFRTTYINGIFIVNQHQNVYKFCEYPSSDFFEISEGYLRRYTIKQGDVVVDCGAYQGTFSVLASQLVGEKGVVIAFEPDPANYKNLLHNLKLNNCSNVTAINKGLWSKKGYLKLKMDNTGSTLIFEEDLRNSSIEVSVVTLDQELSNLGVTSVDFIKADVEGAEIELIKGSKNILATNKVNLAIATYHELDGKKTSVMVEDQLRKLGYTAVTEFENHLTTYAEKLD